MDKKKLAFSGIVISVVSLVLVVFGIYTNMSMALLNVAYLISNVLLAKWEWEYTDSLLLKLLYPLIAFFSLCMFARCLIGPDPLPQVNATMMSIGYVASQIDLFVKTIVVSND